MKRLLAAVTLAVVTSPAVLAQDQEPQSELEGVWLGGFDWGGRIVLEADRGTYQDDAWNRQGELRFARTGDNSYSGYWIEGLEFGGLLGFRLTGDGDTLQGWYRIDPNARYRPGHKGTLQWRREVVPPQSKPVDPSKPMEKKKSGPRLVTWGEATVEIYSDPEAFRERLGETRCVTFDDIDTKGKDPVAFSSDHYRELGLMIYGEGGQFVDEGFSFPDNYIANSPPNMYAPGPIALKGRPAPNEWAKKERFLSKRLDAERRRARKLTNDGDHRLSTRLINKMQDTVAELRSVRSRLQTMEESGTSSEKGGHTTEIKFCSGLQQGQVSGFGASFIDVDYPEIGPSRMALYDRNDNLIAEIRGFTGRHAIAVFRGMVVVDRTGKRCPLIARVEITNGNEWPAYDSGEGVTLDDFIFDPPKGSTVARQ